MTKIEQFDYLLTGYEVAALTASQLLEPVEGSGAVVFPPTFAPASKGEKGGYNIDPTGGSYRAKIEYQPPKAPTVTTDIQHEGGGNVCIIDTVGAEANRIEPLFKPDKCDGKYAALVPQVLIKVKSSVPGKEREWTVNLLDAGHRAGDAVIRFTKLGEQIFQAFKAYGESGDAEKLARIAPTSLVFGVWDSRGTQEKIARIFRSVVRATNVVPLTRSAQYFRSVKYVEEGLAPERLNKGTDEDNPLSQEGFNDNPAGGAPGGVVVRGEIRRDMTINLSALRKLRVPSADDPTKNDAEKTLTLRRYIFGLCLVSATAPSEDRYNLREGCQLKQKSGTKTTWQKVRYEDSEADDARPLPDLKQVAFEFADLAAAAFKVTNPPATDFEPKIAEQWLGLDKATRDKLRRQRSMTQQEFKPPKAEKLSGTIIALLPDGTGLRLQTGTAKKKKEDEVTFADGVEFVAADGTKTDATALAVQKAVEVEHTGKVANRVTLK